MKSKLARENISKMNWRNEREKRFTVDASRWHEWVCEQGDVAPTPPPPNSRQFRRLSVCELVVDRSSEKFAKVNSLFLYELGSRMNIYAQHVCHFVFRSHSNERSKSPREPIWCARQTARICWMRAYRNDSNTRAIFHFVRSSFYASAANYLVLDSDYF